jgi:LacI family transcriptional regulator, gluconate utilization system Gnt-I transcriptional repressor
VDTRATARRDGFAAGLPPGALVFERRVPAPATIEGGRDALAELPLGDEPTALFCSSDLPAAGAVIEAVVRGIPVPDRLAICGFGDFELARVMHPAITTVSVDGAEIGRVAATSLLGRLAGRIVACRIAIPFRIVERGSTLARAMIRP